MRAQRGHRQILAAVVWPGALSTGGISSISYPGPQPLHAVLSIGPGISNHPSWAQEEMKPFLGDRCLPSPESQTLLGIPSVSVARYFY